MNLSLAKQEASLIARCDKTATVVVKASLAPETDENGPYEICLLASKPLLYPRAQIVETFDHSVSTS